MDSGKRFSPSARCVLHPVTGRLMTPPYGKISPITHLDIFDLGSKGFLSQTVSEMTQSTSMFSPSIDSVLSYSRGKGAGSNGLIENGMSGQGIAGGFFPPRRLKGSTLQKKQLVEWSADSHHILGLSNSIALFSLMYQLAKRKKTTAKHNSLTFNCFHAVFTSKVRRLLLILVSNWYLK